MFKPMHPLSIACCLGLCGLASAQPPQGTDPGQPAAPPAAPARTGEIKTAGELLSALESADKDLRTFESLIQYTKVAADVQGNDVHVRRGRLWFQNDPPPATLPAPPAPAATDGGKGTPPAARARRRFEVIFDTLIFDGRKRDDVEEWVFDGVWLVERHPKEKQFIKRRILKPGEDKDPLRIGEGPFPIPVGQKKDDVLQRFDAKLVDSHDGMSANDDLKRLLAETWQLHLSPREGSAEARDFREVRMWYRRADLLPVFAVAYGVDGSRSEVFLLKQVKNGPMGPERFRTDEPPAADGWTVQIDSAPGEGGQAPSFRTPGTTIKP